MSFPKPVDLVEVDVVVVADELVSVVLSRVQEVEQSSDLSTGGALYADLLIALPLNALRSPEADAIGSPLDEIIDGVLG